MTKDREKNDDLMGQMEGWLNRALEERPPPEIVAFNVNLYDSPFRADLVGACRFDSDDPDWACDESWEPRERFFDFPEELTAVPWQERLALSRVLLERIIHGEGSAAAAFRRAEAVAIGFVDGDLEIVYRGDGRRPAR